MWLPYNQFLFLFCCTIYASTLGPPCCCRKGLSELGIYFRALACAALSVPLLVLSERSAARTARAFVATLTLPLTPNRTPRLLCSLQFRFPSEKLVESIWKVMKSPVGGEENPCLCYISYLHPGSFPPSQGVKTRPFPGFGELRCHPGLSSQKC